MIIGNICFPNPGVHAVEINADIIAGTATEIDDVGGNVKEVGTNAFSQYEGLVSVAFPEATKINDGSFPYCSSLAAISFPKASYVGTGAFRGCVALSSVYLPVASKISPNAFMGCKELSVISLPKVSDMGGGAFSDCYKLESLYILGSRLVYLRGDPFMNTPMEKSTYIGHFGSIYVPASKYSTYIALSYWSAYSARIVSVP